MHEDPPSPPPPPPRSSFSCLFLHGATARSSPPVFFPRGVHRNARELHLSPPSLSLSLSLSPSLSISRLSVTMKAGEGKATERKGAGIMNDHYSIVKNDVNLGTVLRIM